MNVRTKIRIAVFAFVVALAGCDSCAENNTGQPEPDQDAGGDAAMDVAGEEDAAMDAEATPDAEEDAGQRDVRADAAPDMGDGECDDPAAESGTRLRRRYLDGGPAACMTVDFWDDEMDTACSFETAPDGQIRCLPNQTHRLYYADEGCSEPIYLERATACSPGWARGREDGALYRQTDTEVAITENVVYYPSGADCQGTFVDDEANAWVAEEVPSAEFVLGTIDEQERSDDMIARYVDGEDGSRALLEVVNVTYDYVCHFDEDNYCRPRREPRSTLYTDSGCTEEVYEIFGDEPPPVIAVAEEDSDGCRTGTRFFETGAEITPDALYYESSTGCESTSVDADDRYYRPGDPTTVPRPSAVLEGSGALKAVRRADDSGQALGTAHEFLEVATDERCQPVRLADDTYACLQKHHGFMQSQYYASDTCTETVGITLCEATAPTYLVEFDSTTCRAPGLSVTSGVWEADEDIGDAYYFQNDTVDCEMRTLADANNGYTKGAEAADSLPDLELKVE